MYPMAGGSLWIQIHNHRFLLFTAVLVAVISCCLSVPSSAHDELDDSGSCPFSSHSAASSGRDHDQHHEGHHRHELRQRQMLAEELAEEEDLKMESSIKHDCHSDHHHHGHDDHRSGRDLSTLGLWMSAMACSLLVSLASLICLILLPVLFLKGTPSKMVVDALATFGAGAMLGDAFLHQLPHAFSGGHSHSHDQHIHDSHEVIHSHSHSLQDLSVGLSVLFGIVLFLLVEKIVRYVEDISGGEPAWGHGHHHHHHNRSPIKLKNDDTNNASDVLLKTSKEKTEKKFECQKDENQSESETLRKRTNANAATTVAKELDFTTEQKARHNEASCSSSLVFGYLNLFSDGVHNFTDGMALGSAFLLYGFVGGWSRTLFLLAHELPQEIGDFGILVRSGFTVSRALFYNFLSALVALLGTALALLLGKDPGQSSLIEGFTAGGFIYIAAAGVLPELNTGSTTFKSTSIQLASLISGMGIALAISLTE